MNCLVCSKKLNDHINEGKCPVCGFPIFEILGDPEVELPKLKPRIDAHRNDFMSKCTVGNIAFHWVRTKEGKLAKDREEMISFGSLLELYNNTSFLSNEFDSLSKRKNVKTKIGIKTPGKMYEHTVTVPNTAEGEILSLGINIDEGFNFTVKVCGQDKKEYSSEKKYMFD